MKNLHARLPVLAFLILLTVPVTARQKTAAAAEPLKTDLTIYNQNLSLIREERAIDIPAGTARVIVPDIPATIDGTSLSFRSLTDPAAVRILEQNYRYDLVSREKLLQRYIGKEIQFGGATGKLLAAGTRSYDGSHSAVGLVAEINGKIELDPGGQIVLPKLPEGLILKPQLEWLVSNNREGEQKTELSFLAGGLSWNANYVALLDKSDTKLDLTGWVTVTNNSGTSFRDAGLKLVAGDVNLVNDQLEYMRKGGVRAEAVNAAAPQFKQTDLFEFKLYTLGRRTDLANDETKQIELVRGAGITAEKKFIYDGLADQWRYWYNSASYREQGSLGQQSNPKVGVYVTFKNAESSGLGMPLPKGKIRVYKKDDDGKEQFIGEDEIDHTPKDEELRLYLGNAFDLVGERAQTDYRVVVPNHSYEETIQIKVRNHKKEDAEVQIYEHPWRWNQWEIVKTNADYVKVDQTTIRFPVKIAKDGEKTVTYTIRYSW
ncbi:MAG TPA: hypothetical protein VMW43_13205 [Bacteroidota bacterium]|nr:hypothetical protein [Bacteroidota bacterium]